MTLSSSLEYKATRATEAVGSRVACTVHAALVSQVQPQLVVRVLEPSDGFLQPLNFTVQGLLGAHGRGNGSPCQLQ